MFDSAIVRQLLGKHQDAFLKLGIVEEALRRRFLDMDEQIRAVILAVASGEPLLLIGPPGTAKSRLIRAFCGVIGLINEDDLAEAGSRGQLAAGPAAANGKNAYFEYLLTPFTEPGELFGHYDIGRLHRDGDLVRQDEGMLQNAQVTFLDEVFNASSAILNSILSVMNERIFHDRGRRVQVLTQSFFAAANHIPETTELRAFFDRFLLRCEVHSIRSSSDHRFPDQVRELIERGWKETYSDHLQENVVRIRQENLASLLQELAAFRRDVRALTTRGALVPRTGQQAFFDNLAQLIYRVREYEMSEMSNRRIIRMFYVMLVHRTYRAVLEKEMINVDGDFSFGEQELGLLDRYFLDRRDTSALQGVERLAQPME